MAQPTGIITSTGAYNNNDLNTIFAPINSIDSGTFNASGTSSNPIGEGWSTFTGIISDSNNAGNVAPLPAGQGFDINFAGIYKLNISLRFGSPTRETYQPMVFILNSNSSVPAGSGYDFIPCPTLSNIYSFGGLCVAGTNQVTNRNNEIALANALQTNTTGEAYMFAFELQNITTNIATFEITFYASANQIIYPQIRCRSSGANPQTTLASGRWLFEKLN